MKKLIKTFTDDNKRENYTFRQWVITIIYTILFLATCSFAECMAGRW